MSGCVLVSHAVRLCRRLLMLLMLKVAIFNSPPHAKKPFCPAPSVTLQVLVCDEHYLWAMVMLTADYWPRDLYTNHALGWKGHNRFRAVGILCPPDCSRKCLRRLPTRLALDCDGLRRQFRAKRLF